MQAKNKRGKHSFVLPSKPIITHWASVAGKKESMGPLAEYFDYTDLKYLWKAQLKMENTYNRFCSDFQMGKWNYYRSYALVRKIFTTHRIDFVIVNGENAADGMGITEKMYKELISAKVNVVTMGNHTWGKKDIFGLIL